MLTANDVPWRPFVEPLDPLAGIEPGDHAATVVRLVKILRAQREVLSVALEKLRKAEIEYRSLQRRHFALIEELRQVRKKVAV